MADEARTQSQQSVHKEANDKCSFAKISENNKDWCNGRGKPAPLRKARVIVQMRNHTSTQTIAVRKASGIVRFWEGWFGRKGGGAFERVVGMARFDAAIPQSCDR